MQKLESGVDLKMFDSSQMPSTGHHSPTPHNKMNHAAAKVQFNRRGQANYHTTTNKGNLDARLNKTVSGARNPHDLASVQFNMSSSKVGDHKSGG